MLLSVNIDDFNSHKKKVKYDLQLKFLRYFHEFAIKVG
jgi:hypothetical protein